MSTSLPAELVLAILEQTYYNSDGEPDHRTLSACSLVCTAWTLHSQKLLFRSVSLRKPRKSRASFRNAIDLSTQRGRILGSYVRTLNIDVGIKDDVHYPAEFTRVLACCTRLYELTIRVVSIHDFSRTTVAELQRTAPHTLKALNLLSCGTKSPVLYQLLDLWPSIQFLKLGGSEIIAPPPPSLPKFRLYDLVLYCAPSMEVLEWLLSSSRTTLEILELRDVPGLRFKDLLTVHGPKLRSLRLLRYGASSVATLMQCPYLEEIELLHVPSVFKLYHLPRTIEHFSFRSPVHSSGHTLQPIISTILTLPKLRVVTCDKSTNLHSDFPSLKKVCEGKGVDLRCNALPLGQHDDPVSVDRFPRGQCFSHFSLMN